MREANTAGEGRRTRPKGGPRANLHAYDALARRDHSDAGQSFENMPEDRFKNVLQRLALSSAEGKRRFREVESNPTEGGHEHGGDTPAYNRDLDGIQLTQDVSAWARAESVAETLSGSAYERNARARAILEIDNPILTQAIIDRSREVVKVAKKMVELSPRRVRLKSKQSKAKQRAYIHVVPMHDYADMQSLGSSAYEQVQTMQSSALRSYAPTGHQYEAGPGSGNQPSWGRGAGMPSVNFGPFTPPLSPSNFAFTPQPGGHDRPAARQRLMTEGRPNRSTLQPRERGAAFSQSSTLGRHSPPA